MDDTQQFLQDFTKDILAESGVSLEDNETSKRLSGEIENRIMSRLFLEMVALLSPDQAARVNESIQNGTADPGELMVLMSKEIPDFPVRMAASLAEVRRELVSDLKTLAQ